MSPVNQILQPLSIKNWRENLYIKLFGFGLVYYFAVNFGVKLVTKPEGISVLWPAIGLALAALLLLPQREWRYFLVIIFVINLYSNLASKVPLAASLGFSLANTLEPLLGGWLMKRWIKEQITFSRLRDVLSLVAVVVIFNGLTALLWALIPTLAFGAPYIVTWVSWWILDGLSMVIITPFIITWAVGGTVFSQGFLKRNLETLFWLMILIGLTWLMFGAKRLNIYVEQNPYMLFPILIWIAFRFSPRALATALVLTSIVALYSATLTTGFFFSGANSQREKLISVQAFLCVASVTTMVLSTAFAERKRAEDALRQSEALYRQAIEVAGAVPYLQSYNIGGTGVGFDFIGEGIREISGYAPEEFTDQLFDSITLERRLMEDLAQYSWSEAIRRVRAGENPIWKCEHCIRARDGKIHWLFEAAVELRDLNGVSHGSIGMFQDITERRQAEIEREKLITELSEKNAELERFTYTVSHDLKSPIVTIRGFLGYLTEHARSGNLAQMEADIQRITKATNKMQDLLKDLLELSRVGRMMDAPQTIQFEHLIHDALDIVHGQIEAHHVTVHTQPNLSAVHGDRQRLTEVLQNLLDNAIKYMGDQPDPRIEIGQHSEEDGKLIFFVKDNGIGIAPEYRERIFGLFNKLDPKSEGTGIGLALVKRIIEVHDGQIWVESELGKGSTFYFSLQRN